MRSFIIRFTASIVFITMVISWYMIPDSFFVEYSDASEQYVYVEDEKESEDKMTLEQEVDKYNKRDSQDSAIESKTEKIKQTVPFVVQAPHAQWDDPEYQDACEEASMLMAHGWIEGDRYISKREAEDEMEKMFVREREVFGGAIDTSVVDTTKFFREYYGHNAEIAEGVTMDNLYDILREGHIIIAPTNGKWLENPNFTNGGPERHMVVIIGFDKENSEFITNDPGTRVGRGYKYKDSTLYNAIRDYKTGTKEDFGGSSKNVIVVKK